MQPVHLRGEWLLAVGLAARLTSRVQADVDSRIVLPEARSVQNSGRNYGGTDRQRFTRFILA
jgi:hypothetical protein